MFTVKLLDVAIFKRIVEGLSGILRDVVFDCNSEKISIQAMDSAHIALTHVELSSSLFSTYFCQKNTSFGVSLASLVKILKCSSSGDSMTMFAKSKNKIDKIDDNEEDVFDEISFIFERDGEKSEYDLKLLDIEVDRLVVTDFETWIQVKMSCAKYSKIVRDLSTFSSTIELNFYDNLLTLSAFGDENAKISLAPPIVTIKNEADKATKDKHITSVKYASNYLKMFISNISNDVDVVLFTNTLLAIKYDIEGKGFLTFYLASKVDE